MRKMANYRQLFLPYTPFVILNEVKNLVEAKTVAKRGRYKPTLCKGGWHGVAVTEGLAGSNMKMQRAA